MLQNRNHDYHRNNQQKRAAKKLPISQENKTENECLKKAAIAAWNGIDFN